jgi:hypothetical protein
MSVKIIGLTGFAGSGKSAIADRLVKRHGFQRIKFADPLKTMLRGLLASVGTSDVETRRMIEGDLKQVPLDVLGGRTPRYVMQTLGTEWGRDLIDPDLWVTLFKRRLEFTRRIDLLAHPLDLPDRVHTKIVVDDVRFVNEAKVIQANGGEVWRVIRDAAPSAGDHQSEIEQLSIVPTRTVRNNGTFDDLRAIVDGFIEKGVAA